jgi:hypothetical protein
MFDDLRLYLLNMRIKLEKAHDGEAPLELFMEEICRIAVENWADRDDSVPDLTSEQINKAVIRVLTRNYNEN